MRRRYVTLTQVRRHLSVVRPLGQVYILQETATYTAVEFYTIKMALLHAQPAKTMNSMRISFIRV